MDWHLTTLNRKPRSGMVCLWHKIGVRVAYEEELEEVVREKVSSRGEEGEIICARWSAESNHL